MCTQPVLPGVGGDRPTVAYDVSVPTLMAYGGASEQWFHSAAKAVGQALSNAEVQRLDGQTHEVAGDVLAAVVAEHIAG